MSKRNTGEESAGDRGARKFARPRISIFSWPEITTALIGATALLLVPVVEYLLNRPDGPNAPPPVVEGEKKTSAQAPPNFEKETTDSQTQEPVRADAIDERAPDGDFIEVNGVVVERRAERRMIEAKSAPVYTEPSTLRGAELRRFRQGDQVAIHGKVAGEPWYVVELSSGYGFVRANHFSKEPLGGE